MKWKALTHSADESGAKLKGAEPGRSGSARRYYRTMLECKQRQMAHLGGRAKVDAKSTRLGNGEVKDAMCMHI